MVRIAIYDRYLSTIGGGERYSCKMAEVLSRQKGYNVELLTDIYADLKVVSERLNLDLSRVNLKIFPYISEDYTEKITRNYDLFINATYLSSLPAYGKKNIYVCYFPTPFDVDFKTLHRFLLIFFRKPAIWLFSLSNRLTGGFKEIEVEEGLYEPRRFLLRRGSWSSGRTIFNINNINRKPAMLRLGFKNPATSALENLKVQIEVYAGKKENEANPEILFSKELEVKRGLDITEDITLNPRGLNYDSFKVIISSGTFIPSQSAENSKDSRRLGVVIYNRNRINPLKKILLKILGYIPLFLVSYPKDFKFLDTYNNIVSISEYSHGWIKKLWGRDSHILYPPVDVDSFYPGNKKDKKEKIILSAGRFFPDHHNKKQLELAKAFIQLYDSNKALRDYRLYLIGGVDRIKEHLEYVEKVKEIARGYPIEVINNLKWQELVKLFARAFIFWHASGMGEDEEAHPEKFEHFGITTVEAMASGCIPVVINRGGQSEIIKDGLDGFLFESWEEMKAKTLKIIGGEIDINYIRNNAIKNCTKFSNKNFEKKLLEIIGQVFEAK